MEPGNHRNITKKQRLNLETAEIAWVELQGHFASGRLISVNPDLDLLEVAVSIADDDRTQAERWLSDRKIHPVTDGQARRWNDTQASLWAVVVKPWVLVQHREPR